MGHIININVEKGKHLHLELAPEAEVAENSLHFHTGTKEVGDEILQKIEESKRIAASAPSMAAPAAAASRSIPPVPQAPPTPVGTSAVLPPPVRKTVSFQSPSAAEEPEQAEEVEQNGHAAGAQDGGEKAVALYDFEAQGDDELPMVEGEQLTVVEKENEDWWKVRNASGQEGVVPASYVEVSARDKRALCSVVLLYWVLTSTTCSQASEGGADGEDGAAADAAAAAAAAEAEAERKRQEEAAARAAQVAERRAREEEERKRREALKAQPAPAPPKLEQRPSMTDVNRAAREVKIPQGRSAPERPKEAGSKSKPSPNKTRVWHDRTGQFKVEAEFLGFNQGKIRLHKLNGVVIEVAVEKMSNPDIQFLEDVTGKKLAPNDDDLPLSRVADQRRRESRGTSSRQSSSADPRREKERERERRERDQRQRQSSGRPKRNVDWFEFFLAAGVDVDDCTRYASAFERDKIDETILADMEPSILRSLGLREGDIIRVMKLIERKYRANRASTGQSSSDMAAQLKSDEEMARKLQEQESVARKNNATSPPPPGLFSGPDGSLKNNTRRGRPTPSTKTSSGVDPASLAAASESLARTATPPVRAATMSPEVSSAPKRSSSTQPVASGFDDDAWTPRPSSTKPSTPAPGASSTPAPVAAAAPPAPTPPPAPPAPAVPAEPVKPATPIDPNQALLDRLAAMRPPSGASISPAGARPGMSPSNSSFLGHARPGSAGPSAFNPNAPRGPLAPVPGNQGLLQPLIPTNTGIGQFVPTKSQAGLQPQATGWAGAGAGGMQAMQPQATGWGAPGSAYGIQSQQTGFGGGMSSPMGISGSLMGSMAPQQTGFPGMNMNSGMGMNSGLAMQPTGFGGSVQPQQTNISGFGQLSAQAQPQQQQDSGNAQDKFQPSNIFAQVSGGVVVRLGANKADH